MIEQLRSPSLLEERQLFAFDPDAREEIIAAFQPSQPVADPYMRLIPELVSLTAAELALVSMVFKDTQPVLPVEAIRVSALHARLGLDETNCWTIPLCAGLVRAKQRLSLSDLVTFGSDLAKLEATALRTDQVPSIETLANAVMRIERAYQESPVPFVNGVGHSGMLRLQGFLWALKAFLARGAKLDDVVDDAYGIFELEQRSGERWDLSSQPRSAPSAYETSEE